MSQSKLRSALAMIAAAATATLVGCQSAPPPAPPVIVAAPVPPPPISVYSRVVDLAGAYEAYVDRASALKAAFSNGVAVERSLTIASAYEPRQLATGAVAYAAVTALQDRAFVVGMRDYARDPAQRNEIAGLLVRNRAYVTGFPGAAGAAGLIVATLEDQGRRVRTAGEQVKQSAYTVQREAWSKASIPNPELRLANIKALGSALPPADSPVLERLRASALGGGPAAGAAQTSASLAPPYTPLVQQGLTIAALSVLGFGEDPAYAPAFDALLAEPEGGSCLNMSKLNLNQCLAVSKPWYEDVFCLGQHVLMDTGQCMVSAVRAPPAMASVTPVSALAPEVAAQGVQPANITP